MLPKNYRLKNNSAYTVTYRLKKVLSDKYFILYLGNPIEEETQSLKIGCVVSKKFHKRAVKRNRIKRLLREIIRLKIKNNELGNMKKLRSAIFVVKSEALNLDYNSVQKSVSELLERIK